MNEPTTPATMSVEAALRQIVGLYKAGRYDEMELAARQLTAQRPDDSIAWHLLGVSLLMRGRTREALAPLRRALSIRTDFAEAHSNLGNALRDLGEFEQATASYRRALEIKPDLAEVHGNLGNVLKDIGQHDEALASYRRALEIKPDFAEALYNQGNTYIALNKLNEAIASYRRAIELRPDHAEVHYNLGACLADTGNLEEAVACYRRAVQISPGFAEAHFKLGRTLAELGRFDEAIASLHRVIDMQSDHAEAHACLGAVFDEQGNYAEADASFRRALAINPNLADAHAGLGRMFSNIGRLEESVASYRRALEMRPDFVEAHSNLLLHILLSDEPAPLVLAEARRYGELVGRQARPDTVWRNVPEPARCLRVGLVSGDLCQHPVGNFLESVLAALTEDAAGRFELFAYQSHFRTDAVTERIRACCHGWFSAVGISDESLAQRIRDDGIDILIDLAGHTAYNRLPLFAWKPAPVQASWLGYLGTTGVSAIDYLIADPWTLPESQDANFTEKIWRLPESYLCFTPPGEEVAVSHLPALTKGAVTFGCFNNLSKVNDRVVALWARILKSVPESNLFLKAKQLEQASVRQNIVARFAAHGVGADRLLLKSFVPRAQYLAPYAEVDIALDPFPYPGITTSVEALWMGVPVLTLAGESFVSRQGVGLLMNVGLAEWVAADPDDYLARAVSHAGDLPRLARLRNGLRQQALASPIFDAPRFAHHFETALRGMWRRWCDQQQGKLSLEKQS